MQINIGIMLEDLEAIVRAESPSNSPVALQHCATVVEEIIQRRLGRKPERIVSDGIPHLRLSWGHRRSILVLAHYDTVWPIGTIATMPFSIERGVIRGPGCFDMKVGLVQAVHALRAIRDLHTDAGLDGVTLLITGDEETGSSSSRVLIEESARGCRAALVLEASADAGALKTERKGVSLYEIRVIGRSAHAGLDPESGVNAGIALAELILEIARLGDSHLGTTVTPTRASAESTVNTVPAIGHVSVDVRARTAAEQHRVDTAIRSLTTSVAGAVVEVSGGVNRPPLERERTSALFERAAQISTTLGQPALAEASVGGASDGNFTAGMGVPTLDGLGAVGAGAHAAHEHALLDWISPRTQLLASLILDIGAESAGGAAV